MNNTIINQHTLIDLLSKLVAFESPYFHEQEIMDFAYEWLKKQNLSPRYHRYLEEKVTGFSGVNIIGNLQGHFPGKKIVLNGHLDTVTRCEGWLHDPLALTQEGNRLYGLGSLDMKGGCAAIMLALAVFASNNPNFSGEIAYSFVSDEEGPYGLGTDALINEGWLNGDFAIVTEPSAAFCSKPFPCISLGARGGTSYQVDITGRASHAACPENGLSAIEEACKLIGELVKTNMLLDEKLGRGSICVLNIAGGGAACSVADRATFSVYRHIVRGEDKDTIANEVAAAARRAGITGSYQLKFRPSPGNDNDMFYPYAIDEDNLYAQSVRASIEKATGKQISQAYFSSIGDFNSIAVRSNMPTFIFGPSGGNFHASDEYVDLDSLLGTTFSIYKILTDHLLY